MILVKQTGSVNRLSACRVLAEHLIRTDFKELVQLCRPQGI